MEAGGGADLHWLTKALWNSVGKMSLAGKRGSGLRVSASVGRILRIFPFRRELYQGIFKIIIIIKVNEEL